ncbi:hypothetical protein [Nostoc sp. FACHB-888]|uniref:hypothetical protein n=1 Tax=Nostoc sp. FACHB-888 TaxID=2692842 RepID=UPI00168982C6|nr:hypothetical protein [Nostoc sp. FACHB-888]MBD2248204.1 hypothetical protein [Nostoc sp. FACHB-888]
MISISDIVSLIQFVLTRHEKSKEDHEKSKEDRQSFFRNFVEPAYAELEVVHKNYLECFQKYRNLIQNSEEALDKNHKVLAEIKQDSLESQGLRHKLQNVANVFYKMPDMDRIIKEQQDPVFGFAAKILYYLLLRENSPEILLGNSSLPPTNVVRKVVYVGLAKIFCSSDVQENKINAAKNTLNIVQQELNKNYGYIHELYQELKVNLLS